MKLVFQIASYVVLFGGSIVFGLIGRPTEMGLTITAGFLGLIFSNIDSVSRFKGPGFEAEMRKQEQLNEVIAKEIEPISDNKALGISCESYGTDEKTKAVIRSLKNPKFTWRHLAGIVKESRLDEKEVENALSWLVENDLGKKSIGPKGQIWSLTFKGRDVFQNIN